MDETTKFWMYVLIALIIGLVAGYLLGHYVFAGSETGITGNVVGSKGIAGA